MKLLINIDEKTYNEIIDDVINTPRNLSHYERIIANGTPLYKIRAEIESQIHTEYIPYTGGYESRTLQADSVLEIIDKYKGESEEEKHEPISESAK